MSETPRMERESRLRCDTCGTAPFIVYRRQVRQANGQLGDVYESVLWPNGSGVTPPIDPTRITCPDCQHELRRVTG